MPVAGRLREHASAFHPIIHLAEIQGATRCASISSECSPLDLDFGHEALDGCLAGRGKVEEFAADMPAWLVLPGFLGGDVTDFQGDGDDSRVPQIDPAVFKALKRLYFGDFRQHDADSPDGNVVDRESLL